VIQSMLEEYAGRNMLEEICWKKYAGRKMLGERCWTLGPKAPDGIGGDGSNADASMRVEER